MNSTLKQRIIKKVLLYAIFLVIVSICTLIYTYLLYKEKVSNEPKNIYLVTFIMGIFLFFILGLLKGLSTKKNGLIEGLISGLFVLLIFLIINFIIKVPFSENNFIKIAVYLALSSIGGIIGVNIRK